MICDPFITSACEKRPRSLASPSQLSSGCAEGLVCANGPGTHWHVSRSASSHACSKGHQQRPSCRSLDTGGTGLSSMICAVFASDVHAKTTPEFEISVVWADVPIIDQQSTCTKTCSFGGKFWVVYSDGTTNNHFETRTVLSMAHIAIP